MAEGAAASATFGLIASGLVCGLVGGMGCGCSGEISKYPMLGFCHGCFLVKGDIGVLLPQLAFVLLVGPWTGFGAVAPEDVEAVAFLAGAVRRGISDWEGRGFWLVASVVVGLASLVNLWLGFSRMCAFATLWSMVFNLVVLSWGCVAAPGSRGVSCGWGSYLFREVPL